MQHSFKKYIAVFCAALILSLAAGIGPLAAVAMAESTNAGEIGQITHEGKSDTSTSTGSAAGSSSGATSSGSAVSSSEAVSSKEESSSPEASDIITIRFNLNGGTGMKTSASLEKGTSVSQLKTPTKTGYRFAGWLEGGVILPASRILDKSTTLTASWKKEASSEENTASVDTRQNQVDAAASAAKAAISDPGVLSSEDWGAVLATSSASGGVSSAPSSEPVSSAADSSGGFSKLLLAGIGFIVLGAAGVVVFIYLQFIRKPPRGGGPRDGSGGWHRGSDDDTMTFTDISSYSDGKKPDDASAVLYPQTPPRTPPAGGRTASARRSAPQRQATAADRKKREARLQASRANAEAAGGGNFDWQKFFDGERN